MVKDMTGKRHEYFEAILQLREVSEEIEDFAYDEIKRHNIHIAKTVQMKNGYDIYLADSPFSKSLGKKLQQQFGGECVTTASIYGTKDGKEQYRITILFRGLPFRKGQKVSYQGEEYKVKLLGKGILLQHIQTGEKVHLKFSDAEKVKVA
ncbi:hypothetical protein HYX14_00555 [Candidatus Woesearchaeota archaeon]|nr:hypothetical protein [Candidatus Woesearchaeota archaeon]